MYEIFCALPQTDIALSTGQQELKRYMYLIVSYLPYSRISQIKKVFNPANAIQSISNQIIIALVINFRHF